MNGAIPILPCKIVSHQKPAIVATQMVRWTLKYAPIQNDVEQCCWCLCSRVCMTRSRILFSFGLTQKKAN